MDAKDVIFILENVDFEIPGNDQQKLIDFVKQSHDRERVLQAKIDELEYESLENLKLGNRALRHEKELHVNTKDRERVLREALENLLPYADDWCGDGSAIVKAEKALEDNK